MRALNYKLNLGKWDFIFAVPCSLVDKYINKADLSQIKVLLWLLRNKEIDSSKASKDLKISEVEFEKAIKFWEEAGFFSGESLDPSAEKNIESSRNVRKTSSDRYKKPTRAEVAMRIKESPEMSHLIKEAEVILGRLITVTDQAVLIMLHDNEGLPIDVILMLLQYAVSVGKSNTKYIENMGINWAASGIDSLEKAENKISSLNRNNLLWKRFENLIGIAHRAASSSEDEIVLKWYDEWNLSDELIKLAYEKCIDKIGKYSIKYMDGILKRWYAKGIFTISQVKEERYSYKARKSQKTPESFSVEDLKYNIFGDE